MFEFIVGGSLILMALIGSHWMLYRRGYYKGIEDAQLWHYEKELEADWEERANNNSNYEVVPKFLKENA
jgi:hypothetical protein